MFQTFLFFLIFAKADTSQLIDVHATDQIKMTCYNGKLQMINDPSTSGIKIQTKMIRGQKSYSSKNITVEKKEGVVEIKCELSQSDILKMSQKENQQEGILESFEIIVKGRPLPAEVTWKWGDIFVKGWSKPIHAVLERGKIAIKESTSDVKLNVIEGAISVHNHKGRAQIEAYDGKILLDNLEGPAIIANFSGMTRLQKVNGDIKFKSRKGNVDLVDSEGSFNFDNDLGKVITTKFKGPVEGLLEQGILEAKLVDPVHLKVKSKTGVIDVLAPKSSGARVDLLIGDGQFKAPNYLKTQYLSKLRSVRGELQGTEKGLISVHSETGKIVLRTN